jgi:hypothetical protein
MRRCQINFRVHEIADESPDISLEWSRGECDAFHSNWLSRASSCPGRRRMHSLQFHSRGVHGVVESKNHLATLALPRYGSLFDERIAFVNTDTVHLRSMPLPFVFSDYNRSTYGIKNSDSIKCLQLAKWQLLLRQGTKLDCLGILVARRLSPRLMDRPHTQQNTIDDRHQAYACPKL